MPAVSGLEKAGNSVGFLLKQRLQPTELYVRPTAQTVVGALSL